MNVSKGVNPNRRTWHLILVHAYATSSACLSTTSTHRQVTGVNLPIFQVLLCRKSLDRTTNEFMYVNVRPGVLQTNASKGWRQDNISRYALQKRTGTHRKRLRFFFPIFDTAKMHRREALTKQLSRRERATNRCFIFASVLCNSLITLTLCSVQPQDNLSEIWETFDNPFSSKVQASRACGRICLGPTLRQQVLAALIHASRFPPPWLSIIPLRARTLERFSAFKMGNICYLFCLDTLATYWVESTNDQWYNSKLSNTSMWLRADCISDTYGYLK